MSKKRIFKTLGELIKDLKGKGVSEADTGQAILNAALVNMSRNHSVYGTWANQYKRSEQSAIETCLQNLLVNPSESPAPNDDLLELMVSPSGIVQINFVIDAARYLHSRREPLAQIENFLGASAYNIMPKQHAVNNSREAYAFFLRNLTNKISTKYHIILK